MRVKAEMTDKLTAAFAPRLLDIQDVSHHHAGHAGAPDGGESHFELTITSDAFDGKSRIMAHRMINKVLADLLAGPIHALQIKIVK